jgi:probable F420-dependent oxidoreductase
VRGFAALAEEFGCESIWAGEHVVSAQERTSVYPYNASGRSTRMADPETALADPFELLSFLAGCTERIGLATGVLVLPLHSPVVVAKRAATLDALSGGRLTLGVGVGWQAEEYAALGVDFAERWDRLDEHVEIMRALWGASVSSYAGRYTSFGPLASEPKPAQGAALPVIIGGSGPRAARRAGAYGAGLYPYVISPADLAARSAEMRSAAAAAGRDAEALELTAWPSSWRPGSVFDLDLAREYADLGVSRLIISVNDAASDDLDNVRRLFGEYRDRVLDRL